MNGPIPTTYPPHHAYGQGNPHDQTAAFIPPFPQQSFVQGVFPPNQVHESQAQDINNPHQIYQRFQQQHAAYGRPQLGGNGYIGPPAGTPGRHTPSIGASQPPQTPQRPASRPPTSSSGPVPSPVTVQNASTSLGHQNMMPPDFEQKSSGVIQQAQIPSATQAAQPVVHPGTPLSPQAASRERARVMVLLDINSHLLQEVVALQTQGKAGSGPAQAQPSPTSPTSANEPSGGLLHSPDPSKQTANKPASQEYVDCMRRLQANLSYLAAIADAKKKASGNLPPGPAIMVPPPHLQSVFELYKNLNKLFPDASQTSVIKTAVAGPGVQLSNGQQPNAAAS